jgi:sugar-specific transcriptional regulator TrmB
LISFDEEDIQTLIKLGLTPSQAKIYLTLISLGVANAKKIAQTTGIDRGEVYRQLERLQEKALIEKILNVPYEYKPMPLNEALQLLIQQKNRENAEIQQKAETLSKKASQMDTVKKEEWGISIIPKDDYRKHWSVRSFEFVHKEIMWYTPIRRLPVAMNYYYEPIKKILDKDIKWRIIAELNKPTDDVLRFIQRHVDKYPNFAVRFVNPTLFVSFTIYDDKKLNFSIEPITGLANSQILYTDNEQVIKVIKDYFELKWNSAMKEYPKKGDF